MTESSHYFGASISLKQCRNFAVNDLEVIESAIRDLDITHFRLMSYWDEHEKKPGLYDFTRLDAQVERITSLGGYITMCIGVRQPRWPESHWPEWTKNISIQKRNEALFTYIETVVSRYKDNAIIISWQLENEALLKNFGEQGDFDRKRLRAEMNLVKQLDNSRPVIMTTSTSWGIPLRKPTPDIFGFSYYRVTFSNGTYRTSLYQPWIFTLRSLVIRLLKRRHCFIHELQAEPWGPANIWNMNECEQAKSMNAELLEKNIASAIKTGLFPIYFWGLEWWYWRKIHGNNDMWNIIKSHTQLLGSDQ